jgi:transposase
MALRTPLPLDFDHQPGFDILTKHKNAIRELYGFGEKSTAQITERYKLSKTTIYQILDYKHPERVRHTRTGRPKEPSDQRVNEIIEYLSESWEHRILNWTELRDHLKLTVLQRPSQLDLSREDIDDAPHARNPTLPLRKF